MSYKFRVFERPYPHPTVPPRRGMKYVTIHKGGSYLSIGSEAWEAVGRSEAFVLLFDTQTRVMGLRAVAHGHGSPVTPNGLSAVVACGAFTRRHGIDATVGRRRQAAVLGDLIVVDLATSGEEVRSGRTKP